jgi:ABC-type multidrug transport system permease subunit
LNLKFVKDTLTIAALKSVPDFKRQPLMLAFLGLLGSFPLFFVIVFGGHLNYAIIGAIVGTVGLMGLMSAIQDIGWDRYVKIREIMVAMPVHPLSYALGVALAPVLLTTPALIFFIGLALVTGALTLTSLILAVPVMILCWITLSTLGFLLSTYLQRSSVYTLNNISNLLGLGLAFLPPVYYPEEILGNYRWIAMLFPTSNAAGLVRFYSGSLNASTIAIAVRWLILVLTAIACSVLTIMKARWREE